MERNYQALEHYVADQQVKLQAKRKTLYDYQCRFKNVER
jgi:hypothetical protein